MRRRLCLSTALLLCVAAPVRADLAPPRPELPLVGEAPRPLRIVLIGLALSAAIASAGLVVHRRGTAFQWYVAVATILLGIAAALAAWSWSEWSKHDESVRNRYIPDWRIE